MFRKSLVLLVLTALLLNMFMLSSSAEVIYDFDMDNLPEILTDEEMEYLSEISGKIEITNSMARFNSQGEFDFEFQFSLTSGNFKITSTSTVIGCNSHLEGSGGTERTQYGITLYEKNGLSWKNKGTEIYKVGQYDSGSWSNLTANGTYRIIMTTPTVASNGMSIVGDGKISNFEEL